MIYKVQVFEIDKDGKRGDKICFDVKADDFLIAKNKIRTELKMRQLPPIRAVTLKAQQERGSGPVDVLVYLQEPVQEEARDIDYRWKKPVGSTQKRRRA